MLALSSSSAAASSAEEEEILCAICLERPSGARLRPCGHDHFCHSCVQQLYSCPLCRAPLLMNEGQVQLSSTAPSETQIAAEKKAAVESRTIVTRQEALVVQGICFSVWLFIFVFGIVEHMHDLRQSCEPGDPVRGSGAPDWRSIPAGSTACQVCSPKNEIDCDRCEDGQFNLGTQCFKYLENMPSLTTGAALGGTTYFVLTVATQVLGVASELFLIRRLMKRKLMPRKELIVLGIAIFIELCRMFLVDIFVMQEYFGGRAYSIFREPLPSGADCMWGNSTVPSWKGADSRYYCEDTSAYTSSTRYYIAESRQAWSADEAVCSTFGMDSSLLNFDEVGMQDVTGHTRFKTLGWVIGGEFALYYFFATFINELADNLFVVPTTTTSGVMCKVFSVALEVFQLGALCPAAVFTHQACLHFTDPLGVSIGTMSTVVMVFGYFIWGFIVVSLPLAIAGCALLGCAVLLAFGAAALAPCLRATALCLPRCMSRCCPQVPCLRTTALRLERCMSRCCPLLEAIADALERFGKFMEEKVQWIHGLMQQGFVGGVHATIMMAFLPMLVGGIFLGTLVVVGQSKKSGAMQVLTAIVLLSDVLFKIVATLVTEVIDFMLHRRVKSVVEKGANRQMRGNVVGNACNVKKAKQMDDKNDWDCRSLGPATVCKVEP